MGFGFGIPFRTGLFFAVLAYAASPACTGGPVKPAAALTGEQAPPQKPVADTLRPSPTAEPATASPDVERPAAPPTKTNLAKSAAESMAGATLPATPNPGAKTGRIRGGSAMLYKAPSSKSAKIADLKAGETVTTLERQYGSSQDEIILYHPMPAYATAARTGEPVLTLPPGAEVSIERFDKEKETYYVRYRHPEKGLLYGVVTASQLETLNYSHWYRVRRANGQEGWVPGKNIEQ